MVHISKLLRVREILLLVNYIKNIMRLIHEAAHEIQRGRGIQSVLVGASIDM